MPAYPSPTTSPQTSSSTLAPEAPAPALSGNLSLSPANGSLSPSVDRSQRRRFIRFNVEGSAAQLRQRPGSTKRNGSRTLGRIPSPPPPRAYNRGVCFDTFDNRDATDFSFTLNYKHRDYKATRHSRTFLCGTDQHDYSDFALEWLIDELVEDGDEVVCLRVVEKDSKIASDSSVEEGKYRQEAERLLDQVIAKNSQDEKAISLVMELAIGKIQDIIQRMIQIYEPAALIVGTRGRSLGGVQGLLPGSVSKYCLQQSPIPVIVVRPTAKRQKRKQKRPVESSRWGYNQILKLSETKAGQLFQRRGSVDSNVTKLAADEAATATEAVEPTPPHSGQDRLVDSLLALSRVPISGTGSDTGSAGANEAKGRPSIANPKSPNTEPFTVVPKSPGMTDLDSTTVSGDGGGHGHGNKEGNRGKYADETSDTPPNHVVHAIGYVLDEPAKLPSISVIPDSDADPAADNIIPMHETPGLLLS